MNKNISRFLPSTGIIIFIIIPAVSFVVFFLARDYFVIDKAKNLEKRLNKFSQVLKTESEEKDTDNDGLLDWQERLYGTDINNKDSDGDGFSDGDEAKKGTDPTDPFNKAFEEIKNENKTDSYKNDEKLSKTEVVARDFFIKLMELKESKLSFNKNAQKQAIGELLQENKVVLSEQYKIEDLKVSDKISIRTFKNNLTKVLSKYDFKKFKDERFLYSKFLETKNEIYLKQIQSQIESYKKIEQELLKIKTPEVTQIIYLEYVNAFSLFIQIVESLNNLQEDPVLVSSIVLLYNKIEKRLSDSSRALTYYFTVNIK